LEDIGQYKYGFQNDKEDYFSSPKRLEREVVENISPMKGERSGCWISAEGSGTFPQPTHAHWGPDISGCTG